MLPFSESEKAVIRKRLSLLRNKILHKYKTLDNRMLAIGLELSSFILKLERKHFTSQELECNVKLPDDIRLIFYEVFPEHGVNMAKQSDQLEHELDVLDRELGYQRKLSSGNSTNQAALIVSLRHQD